MANRRSGKNPGKMRPPKVRHARLQDIMLPEIVESATCSVRMIGDRCVMVENHCGLCALGTQRIAVATRCGVLEVCGEELMLSEMRADALVVRGCIRNVGYCHG